MKRDLVVAGLLSFCLAAMLFMIMPIESKVGYYDPWIDLNDDGKIDMKDVAEVARAYGSLGDPINKTELLLDLQARVAALEAQLPILSISAQDSSYIASTTSDVWVDIPEMSVTINCAKQSHLVILFNAIMWSVDGRPWCRAWIDGTFPAYPGDVELCGYHDQHLEPHGFNFFTFVPAGTRTVTMQWWVTGYEALVAQRTLTVIAIPIF